MIDVGDGDDDIDTMGETEEDPEEVEAETADRPSFTGQMVFKGDFDEDAETES